MEPVQVISRLQVTDSGLDTKEVQRRVAHFGLNKPPVAKKTTLFQIILHQLINPLIFILIAAAIASIAIGEVEDAFFILLVIAINSALGSYQEYNAEKSAEGLQQMMKIRARVRRNGHDMEIDSTELVPGDIVYLESGMKVPADVRLFRASNLEIDESFLTGESQSAVKSSDALPEDTMVSDRKNIAFGGSTIMSGRGRGMVVKTGAYTQVGQIAKTISTGISAKPPLLLRMEKFIRQITVFIILLSAILTVVLYMQGMVLTEIFFFVVALAVSAIPEGLPVALTVALSIATKRMARRNVIVRKLTSVESLGSCTIIASDKTGTLTVNQQTVKRLIFPDNSALEVSGEGYNGEGQINRPDQDHEALKLGQESQLDALVRVGVMANEGGLLRDDQGWHHHGDAMDVALLGLGIKMGAEKDDLHSLYPIRDLIPYESERKFSAAFYEIDGQVFCGAKGAVESILGFCAMEDADSTNVLAEADRLASQGYRVLAFAEGSFGSFTPQKHYANDSLPQLQFLGLACFIDPLRAEARESVIKCKKAGIQVLMITGDHPATALNIATELGITEQSGNVVTGSMLLETGAPGNPEFDRMVLSSTVFARVSPSQKLEIVDVLIRHGEFVAVTGDGVNDAPALKRANLGVAMGSGTDVAKEVGDMIVVDDNFTSIVAGVEEGRFAFDNVRKVVYLLISTGVAEVLLFILSIAAGLPLPLLAVQLLWLNLVTNGIQDVALAFEGGEPGAMERKPRKTKEGIFNPLMIKQSLVSGFTIGVIVFGLWFYLKRYAMMNEVHARNVVLLLMVFMQNFHVFNCRSETTSVFRVPIKRNVVLVFGVIAAQGIHIASMQIPFMQSILRVEPVTPTEWVYILALALPIILVMELFKWFYRRTFLHPKT